MAIWDFEALCTQSMLPLCPLVGPSSPLTGTTGINTPCYARSVQLANTIIFEAANDFMHMMALVMTVIMILHIRSKFTAVGRKEIALFFYLYMALTVFSLVLDAGVIYPSMGIYPYFVAGQCGLASALCTCLLINGFVGFQLYEDGTRQSVWLIRGASALMFLISFMVSILTFNDEAGLGPTKTMGLFVVLYVFNALCLAIYVVMQILLVVNTLQDRWPLGDIAFGVFFFVVGQLALYVFGQKLCTGIQHYLDGLFFATICNLLAVMMVYKYWDSITREDLEFSVGTKQGQWEVKTLLPTEGEDESTLPASTAYRNSTVNAPTTYRSSATKGPSTTRDPRSHPQPTSRDVLTGVPAPYHDRPSHSRNASRDLARSSYADSPSPTRNRPILLPTERTGSYDVPPRPPAHRHPPRSGKNASERGC